MSTAPRLLLLETSGRPALVALAQGEELCAQRWLDDSRRHARDLAPTVAELLQGQGWHARELEAVIVGRGPGSYTGLRVGLMSAKALCYATGCALLALETFAVIATQTPVEIREVDVLGDAQQDKVYVQSFQRGGSTGWEASSALAIQSVAEWLQTRRPGAWVSGPGVNAKANLLPAGLSVVEERLRSPQVDRLLQMGLARYLAGERDDLWALEPLYLRPSAAEEQWQRRTTSR